MPAAFTYGNAGRDIVTGPGTRRFRRHDSEGISDPREYEAAVPRWTFLISSITRTLTPLSEPAGRSALPRASARSPAQTIPATCSFRCAWRFSVQALYACAGFRDSRRAGLEIPRVSLQNRTGRSAVLLRPHHCAWPDAQSEAPSFAFRARGCERTAEKQTPGSAAQRTVSN